MIIYKKTENIIHTHCMDGAIQGTSLFIKNDNLYLLSGYHTIINNKGIRGLKYFAHGWYNKKLEFIKETSKADDIFITYALPF